MRRIAAACLLTALAVAGEAGGLLDPAALRRLAGEQPEPWACEADSFAIATAVRGNAQATCHLLRPAAGAPRRDDLVLYLHWPKETFWKTDLFRRLASESGCTVFGVYFDGMGKDQVDLYGDRAGSYLWPESGSVAAVLAAAAEVRRRCGIDARRLLVVGNSGGGTLAQHVAAAAPAEVDGGASLGGCAFTANAGFSMPFLVLNTLGDETMEANDGLAAFRAVIGRPVLRLQTMPVWASRGTGGLFHHCISETGFRLALRWTEALADLRRGGTLPPSAAWPFAADPDRPLRVVATGAAGWAGRLGADAPVMLPSAAAALAWQAAPRPILADSPRSGCRWARPAPAATALGIVCASWPDDRPDPDFALRRVNLPDWDLYQAADAGHHGIACSMAELDATLRALHAAEPAALELPVRLLLREPSVSQLSAAGRTQRLSGIAVVQQAARAVPGIAEALQRLAKAGVQVECILLGPAAEKSKLAEALAKSPGIRVHRLDPAGKRPTWEHASAMRLLLAQQAAPR